MSVNTECEFVEVESGKWYYLLEDHDAPGNAFDWRENAKAYGPFKTCEAALDHLDEHFSNPGAFVESPLPVGMAKLDLASDPVLSQLIEGARENMRAFRPRSIQMRARF